MADKTVDAATAWPEWLSHMVQGEGGCALWLGTRNASGYGQMRFGGRMILSHRAMYQRTHGPIPDSLQLDHLCRDKRCVNVDHLEVVTAQINTVRAGPNHNAQKTLCRNGHRFNPGNTYVYEGRDGTSRRRCRACNATTARRNRNAS